MRKLWKIEIQFESVTFEVEADNEAEAASKGFCIGDNVRMKNGVKLEVLKTHVE